MAAKEDTRSLDYTSYGVLLFFSRVPYVGTLSWLSARILISRREIISCRPSTSRRFLAHFVGLFVLNGILFPPTIKGQQHAYWS